MLPQPAIDRIPVDTSTPKEHLEVSGGMDGTAQSTPTTLSRGPRQVGRMMLRKPKVTFAATPFEIRPVQNEATPRSGAQRRSIFEGDTFGTNSARDRTPAKDSDKHSALIKVRARLRFGVIETLTESMVGLGRDSGRDCEEDHKTIRGC